MKAPLVNENKVIDLVSPPSSPKTVAQITKEVRKETDIDEKIKLPQPVAAPKNLEPVLNDIRKGKEVNCIASYSLFFQVVVFVFISVPIVLKQCFTKINNCK